MTEEDDTDGAFKRRSTLVNMPVAAETSNIHTDDNNGDILTQAQIQAFQEAFAIFDKVIFFCRNIFSALIRTVGEP